MREENLSGTTIILFNIHTMNMANMIQIIAVDIIWAQVNMAHKRVAKIIVAHMI